jgi:hypothetical protein
MIPKAVSCLFRRLIRGANGPASGGNNDPAAALNALERWSARATLVILLGIVGEAVSSFTFRRRDESWLETWLDFICDALVGVGLVIEYICILRAIVATEGERRISDEKIAESNRLAREANARAEEARQQASIAEAGAAEANRKAAEAELALATWRLRRSIRPDAMSRAAETLKQFAPLSFDVALGAMDEEYFGLMDQITLIALWANWQWCGWPFADAVSYHGAAKIGVGATSLNNVVLSYGIGAPPETQEAVETFAKGLRDCGLSAAARLTALSVITPTNATAVHITIGRKT